MALLKGKLFAGALFAGAMLSGSQGVAPPEVFADVSGGIYHRKVRYISVADFRARGIKNVYPSLKLRSAKRQAVSVHAVATKEIPALRSLRGAAHVTASALSDTGTPLPLVFRADWETIPRAVSGAGLITPFTASPSAASLSQIKFESNHTAIVNMTGTPMKKEQTVFRLESGTDYANDDITAVLAALL